jgi:hypothetical protein
MSIASPVIIANRALQMLGARRITSLLDDSTNARAANACYETLRDAEIQAHPWIFAIKRTIIPTADPAPVFGSINAFSVPADFLRCLPYTPPDQLITSDWVLEGNQVLTTDKAPLSFRYISRITDCNAMAVTFREALSCRMAAEMCEELTQSNEKKKGIEGKYITVIREARRTNAIQQLPAEAPMDLYLLKRL